MITESEAIERLERMPIRRRLEKGMRERARGGSTAELENARRFELRNDRLERLASLALQQARQGSRYPRGTMLDWYVVARSPSGDQMVFISGPHDNQDEANSLVHHHRSILGGWNSPYRRSSRDADFGITGVPAGETQHTILVRDLSPNREYDWDFPSVVNEHAVADARAAKRRRGKSSAKK